MRKKINIPDFESTRIIKKFLWFPVMIDLEIRWLEYVEIEQVYYIGWENIRFLNKKYMKIEPFKMKVTPEQSKRVQEILFENGYSWYTENKEPFLLDKPILVFDSHITYLYNSQISYYNTLKNPELTYEEFIELYDSKLPKKWCVFALPDSKVHKWFENKLGRKVEAGFSGSYFHFPEVDVRVCTTGSKRDSYTEITTEQFEKFVLKISEEESMEKEIIGYRLKDADLQKACESITGFNFNFQEVDSCGEWPVRIMSKEGKTVCYERLENANVLNLWFEPVYKEEEFKVGDWVTVEKYISADSLGKHGYKIGETFKIVTIEDSASSAIKKWVRKSNCHYGISILSLRKATPEEIEKASIIILPFGSSNVKVTKTEVYLDDGYCINYELVKELAEKLLYGLPLIDGNKPRLDLDSYVRIGCKGGTLKEIADIYNKMTNLRLEYERNCS